MMQYGFQRLVLLGSAGYQRAELPLDAPVSLIAPNNTGKTSLINALQFLLIIDRRRMDFGAHDFDKTRRFYFPNNSAYILLEVTLPQTGTVVFGCVGKGVSHDYEYFAYKGELDVEDLRLARGTLVQQPQLLNHLATRNRTPYRYNPTEFRDLIYGGSRSRRSGEPDFTVFKLEHTGDAQAFQQVLTRTLRLDKLTSVDVKNYLLQIFKRDLPDANIDFKQEWDKAFSEVNADRLQYQAAVEQLKNIQSMEQAYEARLDLRGKLIEWRPRIDAGLAEWQSHYEKQRQNLTAQVKQLRLEQAQLVEHDRELVEQRLELRKALETLLAADAEQAGLERRFDLISDRRPLEQQLESAESELERHITRMGQAGGRSVALIQRQQTEFQQKLQTLEQQRRNIDDNLYRRLSEKLPEAELNRLNRVLSDQVMSLAPDNFHLDGSTLQHLLDASDVEELAIPGLKLALPTLSVQHQQLTPAELDEQLQDTRHELSTLDEQLEIAKAFDKARENKLLLEKAKKEREQDLTDYDRLQQLKSEAPERQTQRQQYENEYRQVKEKLEGAKTRDELLRNELEQVSRDLTKLNGDHDRIERLRNDRADREEYFDYLDKLAHTPWLAEPEWPLEQLAEYLQTYQNDCKQLLEIDRQLRSVLFELHSHGLTKYQYSESPDRELKLIIDFSHQLPKEQEALEKKARSAVVNVTASLRELRDGLWAFQSKMREFNRLIGHRRLSDLKTFKIEAEDETRLVDAIKTLIATAEQVDSGDSFELFNQGGVLDDAGLDRAKQVLIDEGNARQGLRVADLFRLVFVIGKEGQVPESFEDIDSAASNGTVLMAKLVTGLAMLYLMQDQRHKLHAVCYLDEALALDGNNQTSLIDTAHEFGFALIFASPAPLTTVRYCVPIHHRNGKNHISPESWQILEPLNHEATEMLG